MHRVEVTHTTRERMPATLPNGRVGGFVTVTTRVVVSGPEGEAEMVAAQMVGARIGEGMVLTSHLVL